MEVDKILKWFMPKEERFHNLFGRDTQNLVQAARMFSEIAHSSTLEERRVKMVQLKALEHEGDHITQQIFEVLNSTFITPMDREDIRSLASDLDDIVDYLDGAARYLILFEVEESPAALRQFAEVLTAMVEEIDRATTMIWDLANARKIHESIVRISELENQADALYETVIADLFKTDGRSPLEILKWKEIYQGLEDACDECKDFTHILSTIVVKST
jgi:uncharacterized protein